MNLTLRQRILVIVGIVSGIILAIVLFILFANAPTEEDIPERDPNVIDSTSGPQVNVITVQDTTTMIPTMPPGEAYVKNLAKIFTERFGTYSNQNENVHIDEALTFATDNMATWIATQGKIQSSVYSGMTTQVLSSRVEQFDDVAGVAQVAISARQLSMTAAADGSGRVQQEESIRDAMVNVVKEGDEWKVDGLWWEDEVF